MSLDVRHDNNMPLRGWGEVVHAHVSGVTAGTTTVLTGSSYTDWIASFILDIDTAAASESVALRTSSGLTIAEFATSQARVIEHQYQVGWPVHQADIEVVVSGGAAQVSVAVEVIRKLANNRST